MRIFPVIVIYKINLGASECYRIFLSQLPVDHFMVYDNSPEDFVQNMDELPEKAIYLRDLTNGGVSVAYNAAANYACEHAYDRILLLDQDTIFPVSMYYEMMRCDSEVCAPQVVLKNGMPFSPTAWHHGMLRGVALSAGQYSLRDYMLINSGLCVSTELFLRAGGYNEKVKLDFADFQFMHRLLAVTDSFCLLNAVAEQDFSNDKTDVKVLYGRYCMYIEGARHYQADKMKDKLKILWLVLLHTLALTKRTLSMVFLKKLLLGDRYVPFFD